MRQIKCRATYMARPVVLSASEAPLSSRSSYHRYYTAKCISIYSPTLLGNVKLRAEDHPASRKVQNIFSNHFIGNVRFDYYPVVAVFRSMIVPTGLLSQASIERLVHRVFRIFHRCCLRPLNRCFCSTSPSTTQDTALSLSSWSEALQ